MDSIKLIAYGKINIGLDIKDRLDDGYHLLESVMQTVDVYDELLIRKMCEGIKIKTNKYFIPVDERNIAYKAAEKIIEKYCIDGGVRIDIGKNIPVGGGMGGGSADAAAVIVGMDKLYGLDMTEDEKEEIALCLGADVPFCLKRGTYMVTGIGEGLEKIGDMPDRHVLIYAPDFSISTKWAYTEYDRLGNVHHPDIKSLARAINDKDEKSIIENMGNSFEQVVEKEYPEIKEIREELIDAGAETARLSGSGSTVFGFFKDEDHAREALTRLLKDKKRKTVFLTKFIKGDEVW